MLIDIHAYVGHWPFRQLRGSTCASLLERMDSRGVTHSCVSNINGIFYKNTQSANEELYDEIGSSPAFRDRMIPFAVINPSYNGWQHDLEVCHESMGMKGIKLYPRYHEYGITDPRCIEAVKMARDRKMPVAFSLRMIDLRQRSWMDVGTDMVLNDIADIVREVPDAAYMVLDTRIPEGTAATTAENTRILRNANLVFDSVRASGVPVIGYNGAGIQDLIDTFGRDKLAFGTETPFVDYVTPFLRLEVYPGDSATKELIWHGNARRILGMA
jgi:uncharacterized protein